MARVSVTLRIDPWVMPYLELFARMGCGQRCVGPLREFVLANGVRA